MGIGLRSARLAVGIVAIAGAAALLAACSEDFDKEQGEVDVRETYALFTEAVFAGDGPVACALMTEILKEDQFEVGPNGVIPQGGSCEEQMSRQGKVITRENGGTQPTAAVEDIQISLVADDGSQPFSPGGVVGWADAQSVLDEASEFIRFFLIRDDWLIGELPSAFTPAPVLGASSVEEPEAAEPQ